MLLNSGLLYGLAFEAEKLYAVSHADMGGIYVVTAGFPDSAFESTPRFMMYEDSLMFADTGDHSIKVFKHKGREQYKALAKRPGK